MSSNNKEEQYKVKSISSMHTTDWDSLEPSVIFKLNKHIPREWLKKLRTLIEFNLNKMNNKETFQRGDFQFEKGTGNVIFVPNENGAWNVQVMPEKPAPEGKGEGWEIVKIRFKKSGAILGDGTSFDNAMIERVKIGASKEWEIYSVKRLSDGEVFLIGDSVCLCWYPEFDVRQPITGFEIIDKRMVIHYEGGGFYEITYARKNPKHLPKQPLFTTSDGKDVYEGDCFFYVTPGFCISNCKAFRHEGYSNEYLNRCFVSESAAKEYILFNKPVLSLQNLLDNWYSDDQFNLQCLAHSEAFYKNEIKNNPLFKQFKAAAKSKIDKS